MAGVAAFPTKYDVAALAAKVLSSDVPIDPPTCWDVLRVADPTPASAGVNPRVPVLNAGDTLNPDPSPRMIR